MREEVVLDKRDTMRLRKCWWVSWCVHASVQHTPEMKDSETGKVIPAHDTRVLGPWTIEVSEEEATTGKGRQCPICGRKTGSYICDGFPTFQGSIALSTEE